MTLAATDRSNVLAIFKWNFPKVFWQLRNMKLKINLNERFWSTNLIVQWPSAGKIGLRELFACCA